MINVSFSHLFGVCNRAFILDNLIESYYVFIIVSFSFYWSLILNKGDDPIRWITMYLLSIELNFLSNWAYLSPIEWSDTLLYEIVFSEAILIREVHNVCNLPVLGMSLSNNDVCVDELIFVFLWLGLKDIFLLKLNVNSIAILSNKHEVILWRLAHADWFHKYYWILTR